MPGNTADPKASGKKITVTKVVKLKLNEEKKPALGGTLDGNGNSIKNVSSIDVGKINGVDIISALAGQDAKIDQISDSVPDYEVPHARDIPGLDSLIDQKIVEGKPSNEYADRNHNHNAKEISELKTFVTEVLKDEKPAGSWAPKDHVHPEIAKLNSAVGDLEKSVKSAVDSVAKVPSYKDLEMTFDKKFLELKSLVNDLKAHVYGFPTETADETIEVVMSVEDEAIIPRPVKADGMIVKEVFAEDPKGKNVESEYEEEDNVLTVKVKKPSFVHVIYS